MRISDIPGSEFIAERHPHLYTLPINEAIQHVAGKILHGNWSSERRKAEQIGIESKLNQQLASIDWQPHDVMVQIGSNDGQYNDPLRNTLADWDKTAILVEPVGLAFRSLREHYRSKPNILTVQAAVTRHGDDLDLYVPNVSGRELQSTIWTSPNLHRVRREVRRNLGRKCLDASSISKLTIPTITALQLLSMHDVEPSQVRAVISDTEGQDEEIIRSFFDAGCFPAVIFFEKPSKNSARVPSLTNELQRKGYFIETGRKDVLAVSSTLDS